MDLPDPLPIQMAYETLAKVVDEIVPVITSGMVHLDFCEYEPDSCRFGEYCSCRKLDDDDDEESEWENPIPWDFDTDSNELPF